MLGVTDPDGDPVRITVNQVTQDEPANGRGDGSTCPDAQIVNGQVSLRAERTGTPSVPGNGRVYAIDFTADDGLGGRCDGTVLVCVPHDQSGDSTCVNDGQRYHSLGPCSNGGNASGESIATLALDLTGLTGSEASLEFALPGDMQAQLAVYDVAGRRIARLEDGVLPAGVHQRIWNTADVPRGVYSVRLRAGSQTLTRTWVKTR